MITEKKGTEHEGRRIIRALIDDCPKVLDLGCGGRFYTHDIPNTVWIDIDPKLATDPRVLLMDVREAPQALRRMHFDVALMTDIIEHFPKADGYKLLQELENLAERIIVFTPLGNMWVTDKEPGSHMHHRSGWFPHELEAIGYKTWAWPIFHNFAGEIFGAMYAWKWMRQPSPDPEDIEKLLSIETVTTVLGEKLAP